MRIAFTMIGSQNWTGGYHYLKNLLSALATYENQRITPVLFLDQSAPEELSSTFADIPSLEIVMSPAFNPSRKLRSIMQSVILGSDGEMNQVFKASKIDAVFESAQFYGWRLGLPCIAWIPDFQHRELPHLFSRKGWWKREIGFRMQVTSGRTIMLSSNDARYSCEKYYPSSRGRTKTVHFAVPPNQKSISLIKCRSIADSYGLPDHFFFMPNQFWKHKNHELVIDALNLLKQRGQNIVIAASGKQLDPRAPEYFPALKKKLRTLGLEEQLRLLGMIPYPHLRSLMQVCAGLLNPSLFEGWSTTVEEARSMGIPMLLSDLPVHQEQMGKDATYFNRQCPQSLADQLEAFPRFNQTQRETQLTKAHLSAQERTKAYAQSFADLIMDTVTSNSQ